MDTTINTITLHVPKACAHCGKPFTTAKAIRKYCSATCKQYAYLERQGKIEEAMMLEGSGMGHAGLPAINQQQEKYLPMRTPKGIRKAEAEPPPFMMRLMARHTYGPPGDFYFEQERWTVKDHVREELLGNYLLCYLKELLEITRRPLVKACVLCSLHEKMQHYVFESTWLKELPPQHHYRDFLYKLKHKMMQVIAQLHPGDTTVRFSIRPALRIEMICMLHEMRQTGTPEYFFADLVAEDFHKGYLKKCFPGKFADQEPNEAPKPKPDVETAIARYRLKQQAAQQ